MKCNGNFIFKTLTHRDAGTFKNSEGVDVPYPSAFILKVDEIGDNGDINERKFKIDDKKISLVNKLKSLQAYQKMIIHFEITLFSSRIALEVIDISYENEYDED